MKWLIKLAMLRHSFVLMIGGFARLFRATSGWIADRFHPVHIRWQQLPKFRRHFISNFIVGVAIAVGLHVAHHTHWISQAENWAMDSMMFINQNTPRMMQVSNKSEPLEFTFLDIDEDTYRTWGEPFHIPRDKLEHLISYAAKGGAQAIVLDVELAKTSDNDTALLKLLKEYDERYPPLFLLRGFYPESKFTDQKDYYFRPSFLDSHELGKNIHWVQPLFRASASDQVVRYWHLVAIGCLDGLPAIAPAFQLLVDVYLSAPEEFKQVIAQLEKQLPDSCDAIEETEQHLKGELYYADKRIKLDANEHQRIGERIIYTLPWQKTTTDEFWRRSAYKITEATRIPSNDLVQNRIVIIGASYNDSRDWYQTPLGEMPGAMIILNAIKSLHLYGQISPPHSVIKWVLELGLIILMSWAFARYNSMKGTLVTGTVIIIILLPLSFYFFKYGLWIDFAVPLLGMQFHQFIAQYEENIVIRNRLDNSEKH
ncbi:CHASE2 domain-containing protein [Nitrosomonas ureae]|uniref:Sensor domain CHASE2-containing protein n=1 Tax=Nitrosomonas ureae TaxID=44577 RepID=A0A1H9A0L8_9PROT|nr:CHASE2 domain-containing protein [Nitrosomonas ureae]SEP70220.1 sensor domain CHASE2-containing protein [Nitrosomonas ureae]